MTAVSGKTHRPVSGIVRSVILREPFNALEPRMRTYWTTQGAIATVVAAALVAAGTVIAALSGAETVAWIVGVLGTVLVAALGVLSVVIARLDYRHYRYEVTGLGLYVAKGWLWRRWQVVPHARVQTVDTKAGPLLRAFGLVAVEVTTASAAGGTEIPWLRPPVADALVEELARRAGIEEAT
jgi:membrane protein YdbS with pleckstrin-like domain